MRNGAGAARMEAEGKGETEAEAVTSCAAREWDGESVASTWSRQKKRGEKYLVV
jgi:hypothetical protein